MTNLGTLYIPFLCHQVAGVYILVLPYWIILSVIQDDNGTGRCAAGKLLREFPILKFPAAVWSDQEEYLSPSRVFERFVNFWECQLSFVSWQHVATFKTDEQSG